MRRSASAILFLMLAGCAAAGAGWSKPGVDEEATARETRDCRARAEEAAGTDIAINEDIMATRSGDWRRANTLPLQTETMKRQTTHDADAVFDSCMRAKGFSPG